ncbi:MAG: penicillin-binding protein activator [Betaproteobacteria bacterium]
MSRSNAILLFAFVLGVWPAFSADPPKGTTAPATRITVPEAPPADDDIDPATGLARSTVVRPYSAIPQAPGNAGRPLMPGLTPTPAPTPVPVPVPGAKPHIALILPTASPSLGRLAEAVREGFAAAREVAGAGAPPVNITAVENEGGVLIDACRHSQATGALIVVGGLTRDGAHTLAGSDCARVPVLALNEVLLADPREKLPPRVFSISLALDQEARQAALMAVADGFHSAVIIGSASLLSKRVQEAFDREWTRAAGEVSRVVTYSGNPEDAPALRDRVLGARAEMVFVALDPPDARAIRPYIPAMLPMYATSLSVNPRAETVVNVDLQGVRYAEMPWFVQPDHPAVMVYPQPKTSMSVEQERLYALGIDAFRLTMLLLRPEGERLQLDGVTGRITLEGDNTFVRTLVPSEVDGGRVVPLRTAP